VIGGLLAAGAPTVHPAAGQDVQAAGGHGRCPGEAAGVLPGVGWVTKTKLTIFS
jgi:hypothetical protein